MYRQDAIRCRKILLHVKIGALLLIEFSGIDMKKKKNTSLCINQYVPRSIQNLKVKNYLIHNVNRYIGIIFSNMVFTRIIEFFRNNG